VDFRPDFRHFMSGLRDFSDLKSRSMEFKSDGRYFWSDFKDLRPDSVISRRISAISGSISGNFRHISRI